MNRILPTLAALCLLTAACGSHDKDKTETAGEDTAVVVAETGETIPQKPEKKNDKPLTLAMTGDIMMGSTYPPGSGYITPDDGASLFNDVAPILQRVDIAAGNLEGVLFNGTGYPKYCAPGSHCFTFKMPEHYSNHLVRAGFDFVGVANNHINDFGPMALDTTMKVLERAGIAYAGAKEKMPVTIIEKEGRKIGFAAFGFNAGMPSINNYEEVRANIGKLREECDFVVVCFHGGGEGVNFQHVPRKHEITSSDRGNVEEFAHVAVDAGADVVYGHSPHVPRAAELYKDRIIFYSLGNFCTPYSFNLSGVNGLAPLPEITLNPDGTFKSGKIHSFIQVKGSGPKTDSANRAARKIQELTRQDFPNTTLAISDTGELTRKQ